MIFYNNPLIDQGSIEPSDYHFPLITVSARRVLRPGWDLIDGARTLLGEGFAFNYSELRTIAQCKHLSLDEFITGRLARGFRAHPVRSPTLVAAERCGPLSHLQITFSAKNHCAFAWMAALPALLCSGGVYIGMSPVWIGLWDGTTYFRAHELSPELEDAPYLIQDFGATTPVSAPAAPDRYFELARKPVDTCEISAVPHARALRIREGSTDLVVPQCRLRISA
jgi:hypothetical protein